jgi:LPS sulfotransferase NodH
MSPRSGSQLLCDALEQTGVAGIPGEHFWHFWDDPEMTILRHYGVADQYALLAHIRRAGSTPNGVFALKIGPHMDYVLGCIRAAYPEAQGKRDALDRLFPNLQLIHLSRADKVRQAVSHWKAIQSRQWTLRRDDNPVRVADELYNLNAIDTLAMQAARHDAYWQETFAELNLKPHAVIYEDLQSDFDATMRRVFDFLDLAPRITASPPRVVKQADEISERWVERYRQDKQAG